MAQFEWSVDPQTAREVAAVITVLLGLVFLLSMFDSAGSFGQAVATFMTQIFGVASFIVPFVLFGLGWHFWRNREATLKTPTILGLILIFLFVPTLFLSHGGTVGSALSLAASSALGLFAGYLVLLALVIIGLMLATNTSFSKLKNWLWPGRDQAGGMARVSVFETVRNFGRHGPPPPVGESPRLPIPTGEWSAPPLDLLALSSVKASAGNVTKNVEIIQKTLNQFGIEVAMGDVNIGPTVTQYTLKPSEGVKLNAIVSRANDLALALAAHPLRIEAPIPGKAAVGVEVPNKVKAIVTLRETLESDNFTKLAKESTLNIALGRDVAGIAQCANLAKMPHLLIAGATGSGKSVAINALILTLLYQNPPQNLRMILVDPKRVEFSMYNGIPHLLTSVITEADKTVNALRWTVHEMERRFSLFATRHKRNITEWNSDPDPSEGQMPYIAVIIDELADLMVQSANEVETAIVRLAQLARATGIHLIVATQRPSVNVITGLIKANITTRIAFAVASQVDSRTIIDQGGAEKLLGNGDMLFQTAEISKPRRIQGTYISEGEIKAVTDWLKRGSGAVYDNSIQEYHGAAQAGVQGEGADIDDNMYEDAKQVVLHSGKASASLLQRRLRVGYARAARLLDMLEAEGVIGEQHGSKPRDILVSTSAEVSLNDQQGGYPPAQPPPDDPYNRER